MVLKRFSNDAWNDLTTRLLSTDSKYAYYEAETPGFSYFAIGEKPAVTASVPVPTTPAETPAEQPTEQQPPAETPAEKPSGQQQPPITGVKTTTKKPSALVTALIVVAVLLAIILIILGITRKRKRPAHFKTFEEE
jgi:hypothetical protein